MTIYTSSEVRSAPFSYATHAIVPAESAAACFSILRGAVNFRCGSEGLFFTDAVHGSHIVRGVKYEVRGAAAAVEIATHRANALM